MPGVKSKAPLPWNDARISRAYRVMNIFWTVLLYVSLSFSIFATYNLTPERLRGWPGLALAIASVLFFFTYHLLYLRSDNWWPMPTRRAVVYFTAMTVLFGVMVFLSPSFSGLGYALIAHACSLLPWKRWILPLVPIMAIIAWSYNIFNGDAVSLIIFSFTMLLILGVFSGMYVLSQQRWQLAQVVADLQRAKADLERSAAGAEELAALRERTRLARDMHDSIGHALVVVNVKLEAAQRLYHRDVGRGDAELEATRALVRETMTDLRRSLAGLRAPLVEMIDLPVALQRFAANAESRTSLAITLDIDPALPALTPAVNEALWQIAREALTNVERHAAAVSASVSLKHMGNNLLLGVADDGSGIHPADLARPDHYGIIGMRERVEALGGTFQITRSPSGGTLVEASLPSTCLKASS